MNEEVYVVIQEFHGDFDKSTIIGVFTDEEQAKSITKLAYLKKLNEIENSFSNYQSSRNKYNENEYKGIVYDEDNDIYLFKYEKHSLNTCLLLN